MERHLRRLPHDPRPAAASTRRSDRSRSLTQPADTTRGGIRHRVRSVSRTGRRTRRARNREPAAPLRLASHRRRPTPTIVQPARLTPRRSSQVCGQCHSFWEFADQASERARQRARPSLSSRRRPRGDALHRPADRRTSTRRSMKALPRRTTRDSSATSSGPTAWCAPPGASTTALIESPCFKNATDDRAHDVVLSCHTMHQTADDRAAVARVGGRPARAVRGATAATARACSAIERRRDDCAAHAHASSRRFHRQLLLQLPHAVHDLRPAEDDPQPSDQQPVGARRRSRPAGPTPAICVISTRRWRGPPSISNGGTASPKPALDADEQSVAASVLTLLKGDAGQRAIVAQSMGWAPAQQASGTGWLAPYLALTATGLVRRRALYRGAIARTLPPFRRDAAAAQQERSCCSTPTARSTPRRSTVWSARATTGASPIANDVG